MMVLCHCVVVFFFFKQKTAYEMRISDWSSDVCSSDLLRPDPEGVIRALRSIGFASVATDGDCDVEQMAGQPLHVVQRRHVHAPLEIDVRAAHLWQADSRGRYAVRAQDVRVGREIGRASCRERVCQYV